MHGATISYTTTNAMVSEYRRNRVVCCRVIRPSNYPSELFRISLKMKISIFPIIMIPYYPTYFSVPFGESDNSVSTVCTKNTSILLNMFHVGMNFTFYPPIINIISSGPDRTESRILFQSLSFRLSSNHSILLL